MLENVAGRTKGRNWKQFPALPFESEKWSNNMNVQNKEKEGLRNRICDARERKVGAKKSVPRKV